MDNNWQYDYSNGYAQPQYTQPSPDPSMGGPEPSDQQPKKKRPGTKKTLAAVALVLVCAGRCWRRRAGRCTDAQHVRAGGI